MGQAGAVRRGLPVIVLAAVIATVIAVLGMISGPGWHVQAIDLDEVPAVRNPQITHDAGVPISRAPTGTYATTKRELRISLGEAEVAAWLTEPVGAPPGPGMVFIHGAGTVDPDAFTEQVEGLASAGIRALVPAKRMDTYSTSNRDYPAMAVDYLESWRVLRELPGVDPARVGFYGESEGAWIAPIVAAAEPAVEFIVLASAPVVSPREQAAYAVANYLTNTNVPLGMFRAIPRALGAQIPGGGFEYIDFDVVPFYAQVTQPVLMLYGTADPSMPIIQGVHLTRDALAAGGNDAFTARYLDGADHGLKIGEQLLPVVVEVLADWVWGLPDSAHPNAPIAGAPAHQKFLAEDVSQPRWYASGDFLIYTALAALLLALGGLLLTAIAHLQRRHRLFRFTTAAVLAALSTLTLYVAYVGNVANLALSYQTNDVIVRGGWLLVQMSGVLAVGVFAAAVWECFRSMKQQRFPVFAAIGVGAAHLGTLGLLITAGYWGLFPISW